MRRQRVLVVEDEESMRQVYERFFASLHPGEFEAVIVPDGEHALAALRDEAIDVVVLDWGLPGISGASLAKALRSQTKTRSLAILMVTGKSSPAEIVAALEAGADDHLAKPFDAKVLLARLRSLVRRVELTFEQHQARRLPGLEFDLDSERVKVDGKAIPLTNKERELLKVFLQRPDVVHSRRYLWEALWGYESELWDNVINTTVSSLRRKLGPKWGARLKTIRGQGYVLEQDRA